MARKITCPHCHAETYDTPSCGRCGKPLRAPAAPSAKDDNVYYRFGILEPAIAFDANAQRTVLAEFKMIEAGSDEEIAAKVLVVNKDRQQHVYTSLEHAPLRLGEGRYSLGKIVVGGQGRPRDAGYLVCDVSATPIPVTFSLPDTGFIGADVIEKLEHLKQHGGDESGWQYIYDQLGESINKLNLRTSDDFCGTGLLQMRLCCTDPLQLARRFPEHRRLQLQSASPNTDRWPFSWLVDWLTGSEPLKEAYTATPITLKDLYPVIRLELAEAVCNSVRNFTADALYDRQDSNRSRLHASIRDYMQTTLDGYGLRIEDITAFQFRSTKYEAFLQERADVMLGRQRFDDIERKEADIRRDRRALEHAEFADIEHNEEGKDTLTHERDLRTLERQGQTQEREDGLARDQQSRRLSMEEERQQFEQRQQLRQLEVYEKYQAGQLKLQQDALDAEHRRRLEAIKLIAGYPPEQQFLLALQYNPELQQAFVALQHARSNEDRVAMAQGFEVQVQKIYGTQSEQTNELLKEAARALGIAVSAKIKEAAPPKPQHVIVHQPANPPPQNPS
jgi:hypothetical protein